MLNYTRSKDFGKTIYILHKKNYDQFLLTTIKNINIDGINVGFLAITENANDIRVAINERKSFIIRNCFLQLL